MEEKISLVDKFSEAVSGVEDDVRVMLTQITPKTEVELEDLPNGILIEGDKFFTASSVEVPYKGSEIKGIPMEERNSNSALTVCRVFPDDLFPFVPNGTEIVHLTKDIPRTFVKTLSGDEFYVAQTPEEIKELADADREARLNAAVGPVIDELRSILGNPGLS